MSQLPPHPHGAEPSDPQAP